MEYLILFLVGIFIGAYWRNKGIRSKINPIFRGLGEYISQSPKEGNKGRRNNGI